ncbi:MAG: hypothetical protein IPK83_09780 [Planctomycetes bacterium]|nr:hypothetical protein [Planctomycetota bacterium]
MRVRVAVFIIEIVVLSTGVRVSPAAEVYNLNPIADSTVSSANPDSNYGLGGALAISAAGLSRGEFQTVMKFDTSAARAVFDSVFGTGNWSVSGIVLRLNAANPNNPLFNAQSAGQFSIHWMQDDSWMEGDGGPSAPGVNGVTFNSLPGHLVNGSELLGSFAFGGATSGPFQFSFLPTVGLNADLLSGNQASLWLNAADSGVSFCSIRTIFPMRPIIHN